jgi:hypothetical protein
MLTCANGHDLTATGTQKRRPDGRLNGVQCRTCDAETRRQKRWDAAFDTALREVFGDG